MQAKRLVIRGRVQGVGYRDWLCGQAARLGISGWVRNHPDRTVEALIYGEADAMEELLRACRLGPRPACVDAIEEHLAEPPDQPGFERLA